MGWGRLVASSNKDTRFFEKSEKTRRWARNANQAARRQAEGDGERARETATDSLAGNRIVPSRGNLLPK